MPFEAFKALKKIDRSSHKDHDHKHDWGTHKKQSALQKCDAFGTIVQFNIDG